MVLQKSTACRGSMGNENTGRKISRTFGHKKKVSDSCCSNQFLKELTSPPAEKAMRTGNKISKTVGPRKRLTDITNTPLLPKSRAHEEDDQILQESLAQLQEELTDVKKMLAEKEVHIEENKRYMQKLWLNYCRKTKQNDEIILHNSQLGKDLTQALEKVKILEHENVQMSALYKFCKLEFQQKLTEALEEIDRLTKLLEASRSEKGVADQHPPVKPGEVADGDGTCASIHGRSVLRKRQRRHYKEPSLKQKMRQADGEVLLLEQPEQQDPYAAAQKLGGCEGVSTSGKKEIVLCDHTAAAEDLGKAEGCEAVSTSSKKELVQCDHTTVAQEFGKAEGCKAVFTSSKKEPDQCDHTAAAQNLGKAVLTYYKKEPDQCDHTAAAQKLCEAEGCKTVPTFGKKESDQCFYTATAQKLGKAEECEAVAASLEKDIEMSEGRPCSNAHTGPVQQWTGKDVGKTEAEQVHNKVYVSTQKLFERPPRRAASSIGSYKEPLLNTKMRRAA